MNLIKNLSQNKLLLLILKENQYLAHLSKIVKSMNHSKSNICYACLNRPYKDLIEDIKKEDINFNRFFFIDTLSSHYTKQSPVKNCIFIEEPIKLINIQSAISGLVNKEKCSIIIIDTIPDLLDFESTFSITQFTHNLATEKRYKNKIFIVLKENEALEEYANTLTEDLSMFADNIVEMK